MELLLWVFEGRTWEGRDFEFSLGFVTKTVTGEQLNSHAIMFFKLQEMDLDAWDDLNQ